MAGSGLGTLFRITTFGESHGMGVGVVIDGCPAGLNLEAGLIQQYLNRRKPGTTKYATQRAEEDLVEIQSGVYEGKTTGMPISLFVRNTAQNFSDYSELKDCFRPGHADYTYEKKYGIRDYRGGGRSSGRETIGRVAAGAVASLLLKELSVDFCTYTKSIGPISIDYQKCNREDIVKSPLCMPDLQASEQAEEYLQSQMEQQDSSGGIIECIIRGVPIGLGEPVFEKLDANLAKAILSIGATKGFEIGRGFEMAQMNGSQSNDGFFRGEDGKVHKYSNHAGGILGGISDGNEIVLRVAIKPTPSISRMQRTINRQEENITIRVTGRHDPIIVPRAVVVVESMAAITLADLLLCSMSSRLDKIKDFFRQAD